MNTIGKKIYIITFIKIKVRNIKNSCDCVNNKKSISVYSICKYSFIELKKSVYNMYLHMYNRYICR